MKISYIDTNLNGNTVIYINKIINTPRAYICSDIFKCSDDFCYCSSQVPTAFSHAAFTFDIRAVLDDFNDTAHDFINYLKNIDLDIIDLIIEFSQQWFGKELSKEQINDPNSGVIFSSSIIYDSDVWMYYPPKLRIEIDQVLDSNGQQTGLLFGKKNKFNGGRTLSITGSNHQNCFPLCSKNIHDLFELDIFYYMTIELECLVIYKDDEERQQPTIKSKYRLIDVKCSKTN